MYTQARVCAVSPGGPVNTLLIEPIYNDLSVTPAAATAGNDTNVTLTLSGTPTTALLQAVAFQMGWTGTLSVARGGTGGGTASGTLLDNINGFQ